MSIVLSSYIPFPPINWWAQVLDAGIIYLDAHEHFEKMSYRNRYAISGSNGRIQLSIPLLRGRDQRTAMKDVRISNNQFWQVQHWRTLVSVYKRSPYFEHYEPGLQQLFEAEFEQLIDFNFETIKWVLQQLKWQPEIKIADAYIKHPESGITDLRGMKPATATNNPNLPSYYQVFADRTGFLPNLSILDLLFSEGPYTLDWLRQDNK